MIPAIPTREVFAISVGGNQLWGTYHKSRTVAGSEQSSCDESDRVGVLFLNPGFLPRASPSAVYWAESFAEAGYPAFRIDLPGLGDSEGAVPDDMLEHVSKGGYAPVLSAIVEAIAGRYRLSGVVIMGLCAGAVTAMFTAAVSKHCAGLVLMDPFFFLPQERPRLRDELSQRVAVSKLAAIGSEVYHRLRFAYSYIRANKLPRNANLPLLRSWDQFTSAGMPVLILKAPALKSRGIKPRVGEFDYIAYLQSSMRRARRLTVQLIEATDHSFSDAAGCAGVRQHTIDWLKTNLPVAERDESSPTEQLIAVR